MRIPFVSTKRWLISVMGGRSWAKVRRLAQPSSFTPSALGGGEGWGEVGDSRALAGTHLTLPRLRRGPLPLPPEGRRGEMWIASTSSASRRRGAVDRKCRARDERGLVG